MRKSFCRFCLCLACLCMLAAVPVRAETGDLSGDVKVVDGDTVIYLNHMSTGSESVDQAAAQHGDTEIPDSQVPLGSFELPATGGIGASVFVIGGTALAGFGLAGYGMWLTKRRGTLDI